MSALIATKKRLRRSDLRPCPLCTRLGFVEKRYFPKKCKERGKQSATDRQVLTADWGRKGRGGPKGTGSLLLRGGRGGRGEEERGDPAAEEGGGGADDDVPSPRYLCGEGDVKDDDEAGD